MTKTIHKILGILIFISCQFLCASWALLALPTAQFVYEGSTSPSGITYGLVDSGSSSNSLLFIRNSGTADLNISSQTVSGANSSSFSYTNLPVFSLAGGSGHFCALYSTGQVKCWGTNSNDELGDGSSTESNDPLSPSGVGTTVRAIASKDGHTCAMEYVVADSTTKVQCWGARGSGQLGHGNTTSPLPNFVLDGPSASGGFAITNVASISTGSLHSCAQIGGKVWCWGDNSEGQLGIGSSSAGRNYADKVLASVGTDLTGVDKVFSGSYFNCALRSGNVWCWGDNGFGQLGDGTQIDRYYPVQVKFANNTALSGVKTLALGYAYACALNGSGVYCWGQNNNGQLGLGDQVTPRKNPVLVTGLETGVTAMDASSSLTCVVQDGALKCWGDIQPNVYLGATSFLVPTAISAFSSGVTAVSVAATATCVVHSSRVKCFGLNDYYLLGIPSDPGTTYLAAASASQPLGSQALYIPTALAPYQILPVSVQFAPQSAGALTGSLNFLSNDAASPKTISLSGGSYVLPAIVSQSSSVTVAQGASTTLSVNVTGTAPITYQWYQDSVAVTGATSSSLTLSDIQTTDAGSYTVAITNPKGTVTSTAIVVSVSTSPVISSFLKVTSNDAPYILSYEFVVVDGASARANTPVTFTAAQYQSSRTSDWVDINLRDITFSPVSTNLHKGEDSVSAEVNSLKLNTLPYFSGEQPGFKLRIRVQNQAEVLSEWKESEANTLFQGTSNGGAYGIYATGGCSLKSVDLEPRWTGVLFFGLFGILFLFTQRRRVRFKSNTK